MAKIIHTFNFTAAPEETIVRVEGFYGNRFSLLLRGTFGGTGIVLQGGDGTTYETLRVTNPASGGSHPAIAFTFVGMYNFNACCTHLKFTTSGGAGIDIDLDLFAVPRPT